VSEIKQFIEDMADVINYVKATDKQKEIGKAWLRAAIDHANEKAKQRAKKADT